LYDYLTTPETGVNTYQNLIYSINERLRDAKKNKERNKVNKNFKYYTKISKFQIYYLYF